MATKRFVGNCLLFLGVFSARCCCDRGLLLFLFISKRKSSKKKRKFFVNRSADKKIALRCYPSATGGCVVLVFCRCSTPIWLFVMGWEFGVDNFTSCFLLRHQKAPSKAGRSYIYRPVYCRYNCSYFVYCSFLVLPVCFRSFHAFWYVSN